MINDISFQSLTAVPSDRNCPDGDLDISLNVINEDGELKPISQPTSMGDSIVTLPNKWAVIAATHRVMHGNDTHTHLIIRDTRNRKWLWTEMNGDDKELHEFAITEGANAVTAIGNMLCFVSDDIVTYALWRNNKYTIFASDAFTYTAELVNYGFTSPQHAVKQTFDEETFKSFFGIGQEDDIVCSVTTAVGTRAIYNALDAERNRIDEEHGDYWFHGKVLGVCAVRLYDGTYINISMPFVIDSRVDNEIYFYADDNEKGYDKYTFVSERSCFYTVSIKVDMDVSSLDDIVAGIDVFVTRNNDFVDADKACMTEHIDQHFFTNGKFKIPFVSQDKAQEMVNRMTFYKAVSISKDELSTFCIKEIKRVTGVEQSLSLADMRVTTMGARVGVTYNSRLHLADVRTMLRGKSVVYVLQQFEAGYDSVYVMQWQSNTLRKAILKGVTMDREICVNISIPYPLPSIIAVPITGFANARLYIDTEDTDAAKRYLCIPLTMHSSDAFGMSFFIYFAEGSMSGMPIKDEYYTTSDIWNTISTQAQDKALLSRSPSLVKVSEAENPIVFPAKNSVQVGSAMVKALAANTQPISEGQFGSAPLYAFTDEGVWVLMTSEQGTYQARQPASRDVCSNIKGILQTDDAVLFPTTRGIIMQQGRTSVCITDAIKTSTPFCFAEFCGAAVASQIAAFSGVDNTALDILSFDEFMTEADMVYSYADARVFLFNPRCAYAYVYSLKTGKWATVQSSLKSRVNIYPEAYAVDSTMRVVNVAQSHTSSSTPYLLCTRPIALSSPDVMKAVQALAVRGLFNGDKACATALFASNDLHHWFLVASSTSHRLRPISGSPYKFFRLVCTGTLADGQSLTGTTMQFVERRKNKLR